MKGMQDCPQELIVEQGGQTQLCCRIEFSQGMNEDTSKVHREHRRRFLSACVTSEQTCKYLKNRDYDPFSLAVVSCI